MQMRFAAALVLLAGEVARGQTLPLPPLPSAILPAPQFASPSASDSSGRAATTAWVRAQGFAGAGGDVSTSLVTVPGGSVARTLAARMATTFNILDYGAVADGSTDIGPALNAIAARLAAGSANVIYIPAGNYRLASAVVFNGVAPLLQGQGFTQGPSPNGASGTWIKVDRTGFVPFTFQGTNARGAKVRDLAIWQTQPASGPGWQPAGYDYVFKVLNALGEVTFDNVLFAGVTRGIYADNSGRLNIRDVQGQFYVAGVEIDDCYDVPRIERLHSWTFASADPNLVAWQEANSDTVILRRVDGIFIGDLFSLGARSALHLTSGVNGVTTKAYVNNLYADFTQYGVWIDGNGTTAQFANVTTQHNDQTTPGATLAGGKGLFVNASNTVVQAANWRTDLTAGSAIDVEQAGNTVALGNLWVNGWNQSKASAPAIYLAPVSVGTQNALQLANPPILLNGNGAALLNSGAGNAQRSVQMNLVGVAVNEPRFYTAASGSAVSGQAIGSDPVIDFQLGAKGATGSVRLQSNGQTVLRADAANGSTDDVLVRGGNGALNLILEGPDANIDFYAQAKGLAGGVRLQANGLTTLRTDNPNGGNTDLLVRPGTGAISLVAEGAPAQADFALAAKGAGSVRLQSNGATTLRAVNAGAGDTGLLVTQSVGSVAVSAENAGAAGDLILAGQGPANGVRMQANGVTVLRADSPAAGGSDLLVRGGLGTVALVAEDAGPNANIVLNPKGAGAVVVPIASATDNSSTAASTAWVKAAIAASGATGPTGPVGASGPAGPAGPVGASGPTGAVGAAGPAGGTGATGAAGAAGGTGSAGATGSTGAAGATGSVGATGSTGLVGATGSVGAAGATGAAGAGGPAGAVGVAGVAGGTGAQGATGGTGPQGLTGAQGPAGPSASATLTGVTSISLRAGGRLTVQGSQPGSGQANSGTYLLVASTTTTTASRMTTDGAAPNSGNCVNPAAGTAVSVVADFTGIDTTTGSSAVRFRLLDVLLLRGASAAATTVVNGATSSTPNGVIGTGSATTFAVVADTTNGCLAVSVTPPNTDAWHWSARINTTEVQ